MCERAVTYTAKALWKGYAGESTAAVEDILANTGDSLGNCDTAEVATIPESMVADAGNSLWNGDAGQRRTLCESIVANKGNPIGYDKVGYLIAFEIEAGIVVKRIRSPIGKGDSAPCCKV